jgi:hypothetical protein
VTRSRRAKTWIRFGPIGLGAALALGLAGSAWGQNLIENGGFDEDLAGWTLFAADESSAMWNDLDASGSATSGSLRAEMVYAGPGNPNAVTAWQCVPVESDQLYTFGAQILRPAQATSESSFLRVQWFESEDCTGGTFQTSDRGAPLPDDTWVSVVAPDIFSSDARSAQLLLTTLSQDDSGPYVTFYDDVFFVPEPGSTAGGLAVLASLAALRRWWTGSSRTASPLRGE